MPYIETADRTRLFYTDSGEGVPVVFVASAWLNSRMWEFQISGVSVSPEFVQFMIGQCLDCSARRRGILSYRIHHRPAPRRTGGHGAHTRHPRRSRHAGTPRYLRSPDGGAGAGQSVHRLRECGARTVREPRRSPQQGHSWVRARGASVTSSRAAARLGALQSRALRTTSSATPNAIVIPCPPRPVTSTTRSTGASSTHALTGCLT